MDYVNYGIIGSGVAWRYHQFGIRYVPEMKFKSVFDINERSGRTTAKGYNMDYYSDLDKFLESDIDAVIVMVPHYLHEEYVEAAAKAGKHVLCEKPMATTLEGCDKMIAITKKEGVKFMIAENHRFLPVNNYIMETVKDGLIGEVFLVRSYEGVNEIKGLMKKGFWKGHPIMAGGGSLIDMGAHKFATINWILNDTPETSYCYLSKQCTNLKEKAEDNAISILKYKKRTLVEIAVSFSVVSPFSNSLEIYGTKGSIIENHDWQNPIRIFSKHENMGKNYGKWYEPEIEHGPFPKYYELSMRNEDSHFTDCIINDTEPEFTPEQAKEAIFDVLLSYLSAKKGSLVSRDDLVQIYKTIGTQTVLEGLEIAVHNNYLKTI
ncbi:MAG: Gfo/Idh/MocA family oxidoreductase [Candidatus Lokiarchaeota archaeon]|nr:Gfo/Idh/MocA family oxidoreductase [Candidatus Lokiarchaeota archaeon]